MNIKIRKSEISKETLDRAEKVLIDNGTDPEEAPTILQALGYVLLDTELYPPSTEAEELSYEALIEKAAIEVFDDAGLKMMYTASETRYIDERLIGHDMQMSDDDISAILTSADPKDKFDEFIASWYDPVKYTVFDEWKTKIAKRLRKTSRPLDKTGDEILTDFVESVIKIVPPIWLARFDTHGSDSQRNERSGQFVFVMRELTEKEADIRDVDRVFYIRFADGVETDAFADELTML